MTRERSAAERAFDRETSRLQRRCVWRRHEIERLTAEILDLEAELVARSTGAPATEAARTPVEVPS
jgi:hypothetical protein